MSSAASDSERVPYTAAVPGSEKPGDAIESAKNKNKIALFGLLSFNLFCGILVARKVPFYAPNAEHLYAAQSFALHHRMAWNFLPIGYSGLLGIALLLGGQRGMIILCIVLSLLVILSGWFYLQSRGLPLWGTLVCMGLLSIYPDFLLSYDKAWDTQITTAILFAFAICLSKALRVQRFGTPDVKLALVLGCAVLVRPNLALFVALAIFCFWHFHVANTGRRALYQLMIVCGLYVIVTTAFHGSPFLPHNGPYNFCAGFNEYTAQHLTNQEDSLGILLKSHQIPFTNLASPALEKPYMGIATNFIEHHPKDCARLVWLKSWNMMGPDFRIYKPGSVGGFFKIVAALAFPVWALLLLVLPEKRNGIMVLGVACYLLPFLLTVTSPRFREPLDMFLWIECGSIIVLKISSYKRHRSSAGIAWSSERGSISASN